MEGYTSMADTTTTHDLGGVGVVWQQFRTPTGSYWAALSPGGDVLFTAGEVKSNRSKLGIRIGSWLGGFVTGIGIGNLAVSGVVRTAISVGVAAASRAIGNRTSGGVGAFSRGLTVGSLAQLARQGWQTLGDIDEAITRIRHGAVNGIPSTGLGSGGTWMLRARSGLW